jgi:hypothetical protein
MHRPQGTVYGGGTPVGFHVPTGKTSPDMSGSLTGQILNQGRPDASAQKAGTGRAVVILAVAIATLIILGTIVAIFFHDALTNVFKSLFSA